MIEVNTDPAPPGLNNGPDNGPDNSSDNGLFNGLAPDRSLFNSLATSRHIATSQVAKTTQALAKTPTLGAEHPQL